MDRMVATALIVITNMYIPGVRDNVLDETYDTRHVLGPSVRFCPEDSRHRRSAQADCEDVSQGKYRRLIPMSLILMANYDIQ
jgi:hypothetical protein